MDKGKNRIKLSVTGQSKTQLESIVASSHDPIHVSVFAKKMWLDGWNSDKNMTKYIQD
jgi:hypothetical protein